MAGNLNIAYIGDSIILGFLEFPSSEYKKLEGNMTNAQEKYIIFLLNNLRVSHEKSVISRLNRQEILLREENFLRKIFASSALVSTLGFYGTLVYLFVTSGII